jgi:4-carboxymuconolactone decarboxylase
MGELLDPQERSARGSAVQAEVFGQAAGEPATPVQASWRDFVFAEVWTRPGLDRRARYLIAIASAAMSGADTDLLDAYVRGALKEGLLSLLELREAALHIAGYGGWPRGMHQNKFVPRLELARGGARAQIGVDRHWQAGWCKAPDFAVL